MLFGTGIFPRFQTIVMTIVQQFLLDNPMELTILGSWIHFQFLTSLQLYEKLKRCQMRQTENVPLWTTIGNDENFQSSVELGIFFSGLIRTISFYMMKYQRNIESSSEPHGMDETCLFYKTEKICFVCLFEGSQGD